MSKRAFVSIMVPALVVAVTTGGLLASNRASESSRPLAAPCDSGAVTAGQTPSRIPGVRVVTRLDSPTPVRQTWFGGKIGGANFLVVPGDGYAAQMQTEPTAAIILDRY
ncbi:MAG: hypothetical protein R3344_02845 [Acidobacteriota bacterium]|nr:hypothetical protein [Acidobacteriota bacterium]